MNTFAKQHPFIYYKTNNYMKSKKTIYVQICCMYLVRCHALIKLDYLFEFHKIPEIILNYKNKKKYCKI